MRNRLPSSGAGDLALFDAILFVALLGAGMALLVASTGGAEERGGGPDLQMARARATHLLDVVLSLSDLTFPERSLATSMRMSSAAGAPPPHVFFQIRDALTYWAEPAEEIRFAVVATGRPGAADPEAYGLVYEVTTGPPAVEPWEGGSFHVVERALSAGDAPPLAKLTLVV